MLPDRPANDTDGYDGDKLDWYLRPSIDLTAARLADKRIRIEQRMVATVQELGIAVVVDRAYHTSPDLREQSAIPDSSSRQPRAVQADSDWRDRDGFRSSGPLWLSLLRQ